jgi:hypothetical protein
LGHAADIRWLRDRISGGQKQTCQSDASGSRQRSQGNIHSVSVRLRGASGVIVIRYRIKGPGPGKAGHHCNLSTAVCLDCSRLVQQGSAAPLRNDSGRKFALLVSDRSAAQAAVPDLHVAVIGVRRRGARSFAAAGAGIGGSLLSASLRANGSRECAPDDRLREAIQNSDSRASRWIASSRSLSSGRPKAGPVGSSQ